MSKCVGVITTIHQPSKSVKLLSEMAVSNSTNIVVIGDDKTPKNWNLENCVYFSISDQMTSSYSDFAQMLPRNHYSRKNLGYLFARDLGADWIFDTDDDNYPIKNVLEAPENYVMGRAFQNSSKIWVNSYQYFLGNTDLFWPRGFPLTKVGETETSEPTKYESFSDIQQSCANLDPDLDAIGRLVIPQRRVQFQQRDPLLLYKGQWSPFNSQATWFSKRVFPLLYLPSTCSFRVTDILRSYVANHVLKAINSSLSFHSPSVEQYRNEHSLLSDFEDEVFLYINAEKIQIAISKISLTNLTEDLPGMINKCYEVLMHNEWVGELEMTLLSKYLEYMVPN